MDAWKVAYELLKDQKFDSYNAVTFQLKQKAIKIIHNVLLFQPILVSVLITAISILVQILKEVLAPLYKTCFSFSFWFCFCFSKRFTHVHTEMH